jgi:hypothetical protein
MITLATTVFELIGKIAVNISEATKAIDDTVKKAEEAETPFQNAMDKLGAIASGAGQVIAFGLSAAGEAIKQLLPMALEISGQVEQGLGGAEAVFGDYAVKIEEHAKSAYASMGLSMADYLQKANKMGALFKGTGADVEEAYDMTTQAMQRAADVAAIMGIDINWAMDSVANMAKGNFFMMDNLGVAMNETTLKAYALEKGITGTWQEMTQAEKIAIAYEMFMERTSYAMGQYTKENDTYSGSLNTVKAAFKNFLSGEMSIEEALPYFESYGSVMIDRITKLLPHLVTGLTSLTTALIPYIDDIVGALAPVVVPAMGALFMAFIESIPALIKESGDLLSTVFRSLMDAIGLGFLLPKPSAITEGDLETILGIGDGKDSGLLGEIMEMPESIKNNLTHSGGYSISILDVLREAGKKEAPAPEAGKEKTWWDYSILSQLFGPKETTTDEVYGPPTPAGWIPSSNAGPDVSGLSAQLGAMIGYLQQIAANGNRPIYLNTGALVGGLLPGINDGLGRMVNRGNYG